MRILLLITLVVLSATAGSVSRQDIHDPVWRAANVPHMIGVVGIVSDSRIVVGDRVFALDVHTRFESSSGLSVTRQQIQVGSRVLVFARLLDGRLLATRVVLAP